MGSPACKSSSIYFQILYLIEWYRSATLADGQFPGPMISGYKVRVHRQIFVILVLTQFYTGRRFRDQRD